MTPSCSGAACCISNVHALPPSHIPFPPVAPNAAAAAAASEAGSSGEASDSEDEPPELEAAEVEAPELGGLEGLNQQLLAAGATLPAGSSPAQAAAGSQQAAEELTTAEDLAAEVAVAEEEEGDEGEAAAAAVTAAATGAAPGGQGAGWDAAISFTILICTPHACQARSPQVAVDACSQLPLPMLLLPQCLPCFRPPRHPAGRPFRLKDAGVAAVFTNCSNLSEFIASLEQKIPEFLAQGKVRRSAATAALATALHVNTTCPTVLCRGGCAIPACNLLAPLL